MISGAGSVIKSGAGSLALSAVNTYTGTTAINGGTLQIGGAGSLGSGAYTNAISIASGATLQYSSSGAQTLSGVISGAGAVTKDTSSSSTLTLTGVNTYTGGTNVNAGTVAVGVTDSLGAANSPVAIGSAGTVAINYPSPSSDTVYAHTWSGTGALNVTSSSTSIGTSAVISGNGASFSGTITTSGNGKVAFDSLDFSSSN